MPALRFTCVLLVLLAPAAAPAQAPAPHERSEIDPRPTDDKSAAPPAAPAGPDSPASPAVDGADSPEGPTEIATRSPLTTREAPGVVSVVQREEIERSGAVDLIDILHLVPGFSFGVDVEGVVAVAFRGLWGHEGKVLFLLDGLEMNETLYAAMPLGLHIPAAIIERVEVIRGPGSVVYGGYAELAVVNIVTRDSRTLSGPAASVTYGQMGRAFGLLGASASYAGTVSRARGVSLSAHIAYTDGVRSDRAYTDFAGSSYDMAADSRHGGLLVNVAAAWRGLKLRLIYDDYRIDSRDGVDLRLDAVSRQRFESALAEIRYEARLTPQVTLTPRITFKHQTPWQDTNPDSPLFYDKSAERALAGLQLSWTPHRMVALLAGAEGMLDHARVNDLRLVGFQTLFGGERTVTYGNLAGYAQLLFRNVVANITLGARFEYHSHFGSSFVPRVGLTRVLGRFHFKLLFSQAFRAPAIENLNINPSLQPEVADRHVGKEHAEIRLVDTELGLHGERSEADLAADQAATFGEPGSGVDLLDGVGGIRAVQRQAVAQRGDGLAAGDRRLEQAGGGFGGENGVVAHHFTSFQ